MDGPIEEGMEEGHADLSDIAAVERVFEEHIYRIEQHIEPAPIELGDRWICTLPGHPDCNEGGALETFFKIVMVRDRLRVMEQQINAQEKLSDEDKVNRSSTSLAFGSLTTFNVKYKDDQFKGPQKR